MEKSVDTRYGTAEIGRLDSTTALAVTRTRLSAERTLMSWIRTAFSMISFGVTIIKFFQYLKNAPESTAEFNHAGTGQLGIFLIVLGLVSLLPATLEYRRELKQLSMLDHAPIRNYALYVAILVALFGVFALVIVLTNRFF